jgi:hypothetical protein
MMEAVKVGLTQGLHNVFLLSTILMVIGFVLTFFIEEVPLRGGRERAVKEQMQEDVAEAVS